MNGMFIQESSPYNLYIVSYIELEWAVYLRSPLTIILVHELHNRSRGDY
jgi:hypothetical protein